MGYYNPELDFSKIVGETFTKVVNTGDEIQFLSDVGSEYKLYHDQDCCESVYVDDVIGDLSDLENTPILHAEESDNGDNPKDYVTNEYEQWTFYRVSTIKGTVVIRFYGESNGYYSTSVSFDRL